jgi:hypothetical protein
VVPLSWAALEKLPISPRPSTRAAGLMQCCCNNSMPALTTSVWQRPRVWHRLSSLAEDFVAYQAMQGCRFIGAEASAQASPTQPLQAFAAGRAFRRLLFDQHPAALHQEAHLGVGQAGEDSLQVPHHR